MEKNVEYYLNLPYTYELHPDPDAGWFVRVKELPGCMSQADSPEEAMSNIREVLPLWLETALEDGYAIPEPRPVEEYSGKFVVRVPRSLHRELAETAEREGVSLNQFVSTALAKAVSTRTERERSPEGSYRVGLHRGTEARQRRVAESARPRRGATSG